MSFTGLQDYTSMILLFPQAGDLFCHVSIFIFPFGELQVRRCPFGESLTQKKKLHVQLLFFVAEMEFYPLRSNLLGGNTQSPPKPAPCKRGRSLFGRSGDSNHVRTGRWPVREPVRTLVSTFISFSRLPQGKKKCRRISPSPPSKHGNIDRFAVLFFLCYDEYGQDRGTVCAAG